ncbi:MAG: lipopolysaccharide kinase InaA family protein, partial [Candidatus Brocadia sp.]
VYSNTPVQAVPPGNVEIPMHHVNETTRNPVVTILRKDRYKVLGEFEATHANKSQTYIIKAYKYPHLIQKIKQLFKPTRAFLEFNTTCIAAMKGVPVEIPVAYGERKHLFARESYLIMRRIKHCHTMREYFKSDFPLGEKRDVLRKFGNLAKTIHDAGVKQDDFSLDNFLVYNDETGEKRAILIDFERVSIQTKFLSEKHRVWYLAKLNRAKSYFTNTDRLRFLMSYTNGDRNYCKKLANQIETITVSIQKKDAHKFHKQCIRENRKFGVFKDSNFFGHYRKQYPLETMIPLLNTLGGTTQDVLYRNNFQILHFTGQPRCNQTLNMDQGSGIGGRMPAARNLPREPQPLTPLKARFSYATILKAWMHANALFALRINVPIPAGVFKTLSSQLPKEGFLVSRMPENTVLLNQYIDLHQDKNRITSALLSLAEQVSPFGIFTKDLNTQDILVRMSGNRLTCYLGNYTAFQINRRPIQKNRATNTDIIRQLHF